MPRKLNKKGMTLVEITVVLLIACILMTITGGILINSLGYFQDTTELSIDKSVGDGILDFIKSEIEYSTDVRVRETKPEGDNWHNIYVQNGQLYRDDKIVFSDDYYNNRRLQIDVNGFKNGYRLDMKISLKSNDETMYRTSHTFELLNLKKTKKADSTYNPFDNILTPVTICIDKNNSEKADAIYKIWYQKDFSSINPDEDNKDDPTPSPNPTPVVGGNMVGDQIKCLNTLNNWGVYAGATQYPIGMFVYYNGYWWQLMAIDWNCYVPGNRNGETVNRYWKKIDNQFDYSSYYEKGDIVYNNGKKYICTSNFETGATFYADYYGNRIYIDLGEEGPNQYVSVNWKNYFKEYQEGDEENYGTHDCSKYWENNTRTVAEKLNNYNVDEIKTYSTTSTYKVGSIVKMKYMGTSTKNDKYDYCYYLKVLDGNGKPGTSASSGWQILDNRYHPESAYLKDDIVYYCGKGYIKASNNINFDNKPLENIYQTGINWDEYGG